MRSAPRSAADLGGPRGRPAPSPSDDSFPPPTLAIALAAILASAAVGGTILAAARLSLAWGVASVLLASAASVLAVLASPHARQTGTFLPLSFIGLWALGYGLASVAWRDPTNELFARNLTQLRVESLPFGLAMATAGLLAWSAGYVVLPLRAVQAVLAGLRRWSTRSTRGLAGSDYSVRRICGIYAIGLAARLALLAIGRYSYITADLQGATTQSAPIAAVLGHLEFLSTVGLFLLAYVSFRSRSSASCRLLIAALALEIPFGLLSGMRSTILLRLLGIAVTYFLVRRRLPVVASAALVGALAVLSPFNDAYRGEVRDASGTTVTARGAADLIPALLGTTLAELSPGDLISGPVDFVTGRLRFVDEVAMVGQRSPSEIGYIPAADTVTEAATVLIPRAIWAGKPVYVTGLQYARDYWGQPDFVISSRSPTYAGDAYRRGGWVGLIVLMGLLGGLMAAVSNSLSPRLYPAAIPMFIVAWTELVNVEGSLALLGATLVQAILITAVAMRWASSARRDTVAATGPPGRLPPQLGNSRRP